MSITRIYALKLDERLTKYETIRLMKIVSNEKFNKVIRYKKWDDLQRGLMSDVLTRAVISEMFNAPIEDIRFKTNGYGKPYVDGLDVHFNCSHSGKWVVCALNENCPVGIDIEAMKPIEMDFTRNVFTMNERKMLEKLDNENKLRYFYKVWTVKESFIKADGRGMSLPLNSIDTLFLHDGVIKVLVNGLLSGSGFKSSFIDDHHLMTVCCHKCDADYRFHVIGVNDIISYAIENKKEGMDDIQ